MVISITHSQRFLCCECGRQFVENPTQKLIDQATRELIDRLLLERIPLAGIARECPSFRAMATVLCQSEICTSTKIPRGSAKKKGKLTIQCDELWSFVDNKGNKQWVWLAMEVETREIIGVYIGSRDEEAAWFMWLSLPPVYRQCAFAERCFSSIAYTDFWAPYSAVLPSKRHRAVGKESGKTSYIERFNNTLRQRVSRQLLRKTLSFSK